MPKKLALALLYGVLTVLIYIYGQSILVWLQEAPSLPLIIATAIIMALFPIIPYPVVGGAIGAALGPALGAAVTWIGSAAASILMFLFVRYVFQQWGERALHRYQRIGRLTVLFEQNAFLAILFARLLPFVPSIIVNVYAALSRVSFTAYAIASSIGKIPAMLLFAMVGDNLVSNPRNIAVTLAVYALFLGVTLGAYTLWRRSRNRAAGSEA